MAGAATITGSTFTNNTATYQGGAIYNFTDVILNIGTSAVSNNTADHIFGTWNDLGGNTFNPIL